MKRRVIARSLVALALAAAGGLYQEPVLAATGLQTLFWAGSNFSLSTSTHNSSNAAAFWQNIVNSTGPCLAVNGLFNTSTRNTTITLQSNWDTSLNTPHQPDFPNLLPADGIVNKNDWNGMQFSTYAVLQGEVLYRHQYRGYTDGYATQYWQYYGGGGYALMGWNQFVPNWFFNPYRISQGNQNSGWTLIAATSNRTIGSYSCTA